VKQVGRRGDVLGWLHKPDGQGTQAPFRKRELIVNLLKRRTARMSRGVIQQAGDFKFHRIDQIPRIVDVPADHGTRLAGSQVSIGHTVPAVAFMNLRVKP